MTWRRPFQRSRGENSGVYDEISETRLTYRLTPLFHLPRDRRRAVVVRPNTRMPRPHPARTGALSAASVELLAERAVDEIVAAGAADASAYREMDQELTAIYAGQCERIDAIVESADETLRDVFVQQQTDASAADAEYRRLAAELDRLRRSRLAHRNQLLGRIPPGIG